MNPKQTSFSRFSEDDLFLFKAGSHFQLAEKMGGRLGTLEGQEGAFFRLWAPGAKRVSVIGAFNAWDPRKNPLSRQKDSGLWETFVLGARQGQGYKFHLDSVVGEAQGDKADPFALFSEVPPGRASRLWSSNHRWNDEAWMKSRSTEKALHGPMSVYEMHLGSWRKAHADGFLNYRELAPLLGEYVTDMGFTHVEFMPLMEHPYEPSWGYQTTGFFSPSSRFGTPDDLRFLIDHLHQRGVGVILDWVPSHFPTDAHGLAFFDGTHLFEHADPRQGFHPDWKTLIFNYNRGEVVSFLISSALHWLRSFHADGIRVDAVASMLYLDYSRADGEWIPNRQGGKENLEAVDFLRRLNQAIEDQAPGALTIAEESTAWPGVTRSAELGGLGFHLKWDMGWMNDTLKYFSLDPLARKYEHQLLTFRPMYHDSERFLLPLSHDEVVHGKRSLLDKMPGSLPHRYANLRTLYAFMWAIPGKKLLFMGGEFGQWLEWNHQTELSWHLLEEPAHLGLQSLVRDLNRLLVQEKALWNHDHSGQGFEWIDCHDSEQSVVSFLRPHHSRSDEIILVVLNLTPVSRWPYRIGLPLAGIWEEILSTDATEYGGLGGGNFGSIETEVIEQHGRPFSAEFYLPPLSALYFRYRKPDEEDPEEVTEGRTSP